MSSTALIIDHDDSFIWNIKSWLEPEFKVSIVHHTQTAGIKITNYNLVILSPGPKTPLDYPDSLELLKSSSAPILGICLGLQMMTLMSGGTVSPYTPPKHGKVSRLKSENKFHDLTIGRYHSLHCQPSSDFKIIASSQDDHCVMWCEHKNKKQMGFQFHPESFLTESADLYKNYVLNWMKS